MFMFQINWPIYFSEFTFFEKKQSGKEFSEKEIRYWFVFQTIVSILLQTMYNVLLRFLFFVKKVKKIDTVLINMSLIYPA